MNHQTNSYYKYHQDIVFVDAERFENRNSVTNRNPEIELVVIDSTKDGIEQITKILAERRNINSLQIITSVKGNKGRNGTLEKL